MGKWSVSVGIQMSIGYDDIVADTKEEAMQVAQYRALEDIDWNNCDCDIDSMTVYSCYEEDC